MLPNKIGPMKKLTLLVDGLKAKYISKTLNEQATTDVAEYNGGACNLSKEKEDKQCQDTCREDTSMDTSDTTDNHDDVTVLESSFDRGNQQSPVPKRDQSFDISKFIPTYSSVVQELLKNGKILNDWNKFIEETAYHVLSVTDTTFSTRDAYGLIGRALYQKYPCIGFSTGSQPWTHFTSRLSQKIRNIRWKWNKCSETQSSDGPPTKKKGPRTHKHNFLEDSTDDAATSETLDDMVTLMQEEMGKPKTERNKAMILKLQRDTFTARRKFIQSVEDGNLSTIVKQYPILGITDYIVKEFEIMKPALKKEVLQDKWTDVLNILDKMFGHDNQNSDDNEDGNSEVMSVIEKVLERIRFKTTKKEKDMLTKVNVTAVNLSSKKGSPPRAILVTNADGSINNTYIVGDGIEIESGKDLKFMLQFLVIVYYVFDLSYPKCYQMLGFIQTAVLDDKAKFHKGSNYLKFEKEFMTYLNNGDVSSD